MPTTILTLAEYKARVGTPTGTERDTELQAVIDAAALWFAEAFDWQIEQATRTILLDGNDALGPHQNVLLVPARFRPVIHSGGDLATVSEDGSALSVAVGYNASADVILVAANTEARCELAKPSSPWSPGYQNVTLTAKCGHASAAIPEWVTQVVCEVAILMFRSPEWIGKASRSTKAGAIAFEKDLSPHTRMLLDRQRDKVA